MILNIGMAIGRSNRPSFLRLILFITLFRIVIVILDAIADLNPRTGLDTVSFANEADTIANQFLRGDFKTFIFNVSGSTNEYWGILLSPFWMLPGPSEVYASLFIVLLSSIGIYNVYLMGWYHHSHKAGVIAIIPLVIAPNFIAVQGSIFRDGVIFFALTTAARYLSILTYSTRSRIIIPAISLSLAYYLRDYTFIIFSTAILLGIITSLAQSRESIRNVVYISPFGILPTLFVLRDYIQQQVQSIIATRSHAARGRAAYLPEVLPETLSEVIAFSWIGLLYFLFSPFIWQVSSPVDLGGFLESTMFLVLIIPAVFGARFMLRRRRAATVGILTGFFVGATLFGLGSGNYGTALRHRQMFVWVITLYAAIGIAQKCEIEGIDGYFQLFFNSSNG